VSDNVREKKILCTLGSASMNDCVIAWLIDLGVNSDKDIAIGGIF